MKKFMTVFAVLLALLPLTLFAGCKKAITAEYVKNRSFYVASATKNVATNKFAVDGNFRIHFFDEYFMVELGESGGKNYGLYVGTFEAGKDEVKLNITEKSGIFKDGIPSEYDLSARPLKFEDCVLSTEYICSDLVIVKYRFECEE